VNVNTSVDDLEERLRTAYRAAADTIAPESLPGLGKQVVRVGRQPRGRWVGIGYRDRGRRQFLMPAAAAAAVVAAAVTVTAVHGMLASPGSKRTLPTAPVGQHQHRTAKAPRHRASYLPQVADGIPGFYVQLGVATAASGSAASSQAVSGPAQVLDVYSTATGKLLDRVPLPGKDGSFAQLAPMSSTLTYIVSANPTGKGCGTALYKLQLTASGSLGSLTRAVSLPDEDLYSVTAAADGNSVAYSGGYCNNPGDDSGDIGYVDLATGAITRWTAPKQQDIGSVSLSADGSKLAYAIAATSLYRPLVAVLDTSSPAGQLASVAENVASGDLGSTVPGIRLGTVPDAVALAADGRTSYICGGGVWIDNTYSTAPVPVLRYVNGTPTVIARLSQSGNCYLALDPTGRFLLATSETVAQTPQFGLQVINLSTGRVTTVPTSPSANLFGVTW
jgi:hypothetical protein